MSTATKAPATCKLCGRETAEELHGNDGCPGTNATAAEMKAWAPYGAYWLKSGQFSATDHVDGLLAAHQLGEKAFGSVLCEVSTSGMALEVLQQFVSRTAETEGPL